MSKVMYRNDNPTNYREWLSNKKGRWVSPVYAWMHLVLASSQGFYLNFYRGRSRGRVAAMTAWQVFMVLYVYFDAISHHLPTSWVATITAIGAFLWFVMLPVIFYLIEMHQNPERVRARING